MTFDPNSKVIYQRGKTSIFHQKSEGILHSLFAGTSIRICRYYHQNLLQVIPSDLEGKTVYFSDKVFSLGTPSVCPHLTTVHVTSYAWSMRQSSHRPSNPAYYIEDCWIFGLLSGAALYCDWLCRSKFISRVPERGPNVLSLSCWIFNKAHLCIIESKIGDPQNSQKIVKPNTVQCISRPRSTVVYAASVCRVKKWLIEGAIGPQKSGLCYHSELKSRISFKIPLFGPQHEKIFDLIHSKVKNKGQ